jgi:hypothetical protein
MNILEEIKKRFEKDFHSPIDEWEYLSSFVARGKPERLSILRWIFSKSPAYWDTRAKAGQILLQQNEEETWKIIEKLIHSNDPDDNGTALTLLQSLNDPHGIQLAQQWLTEDTHPATQFEASWYLWNIFPDQVRQRLKALLDHSEESIRRRASEMLSELER